MSLCQFSMMHYFQIHCSNQKQPFHSQIIFLHFGRTSLKMRIINQQSQSIFLITCCSNVQQPPKRLHYWHLFICLSNMKPSLQAACVRCRRRPTASLSCPIIELLGIPIPVPCSTNQKWLQLKTVNRRMRRPVDLLI